MVKLIIWLYDTLKNNIIVIIELLKSKYIDQMIDFICLIDKSNSSMVKN